jgi:dTDP-glucose pyrophosphorylase/CBS domain-containing protein
MMQLTDFVVAPQASLRQVMACIDHNKKGIALVVDRQRKLLGTITDGDIRRAILSGKDLDQPASTLLVGPKGQYRAPLTAPVGTPDTDLLRMMNKSSLRHIPILDKKGRVVDVVLLGDLIKEYELPLTAVVMAGGLGTRLRPLTEKLPKPMLPVGDRPLLELMIKQLRRAGIHRVNLTTHYKGEVIADHFGDGRNFGVEIRYVKEDHPLGTAGALSLLDVSNEPLLVINGDLLTHVDFRAMLDFHREYRGDMTMAVREYEFRVPYGVVETDGVTITGISEKPLVRHFINAGIYLLNPEIRQYIPNGQACDMPDLISRLVAERRRVVSFPVREYWLDIGQVEDYKRAQNDFENGEIQKDYRDY